VARSDSRLGPPALISARVPVRLDEDRVAALCAALLVTRDQPLADLASALDISIPAVRENLDRVAERLVPVGFLLTDDGARVCLFPLPCAEAAVRTVSDEEDVEEVATPSVADVREAVQRASGSSPPTQCWCRDAVRE
jgi:hypothetical protein